MIRVRFFASLRERIGRSEAQINATDGLTVAGVWRTVSASDTMPPRLLAAVNHDYAQADTGVRDGDEVAFFPPVTGG
jgi:sulfur-carrier protein